MKIGKGVWITGAVLAATGIMMGGRTQAVKEKKHKSNGVCRRKIQDPMQDKKIKETKDNMESGK